MHGNLKSASLYNDRTNALPVSSRMLTEWVSYDAYINMKRNNHNSKNCLTDGPVQKKNIIK